MPIMLSQFMMNEVIGHCGMWIVLDECHITNVAVLETFERQWNRGRSDEGSDCALQGDGGSPDDT